MLPRNINRVNVNRPSDCTGIPAKKSGKSRHNNKYSRVISLVVGDRGLYSTNAAVQTKVFIAMSQRILRISKSMWKTELYACI